LNDLVLSMSHVKSGTFIASSELLFLLLTGCGPMEAACTEIGAPPGVAVIVEKTIAADVDDVRLTVCWSGNCTDHRVQLAPGSDTVDLGCNGSDPHSGCSATAVPNGTKVGFADVPELPTGTVTITATVRRAGERVVLPMIDVQSKPTYPNGPQCGPQGAQAQVVVGASGLR
jgi:hypothetical protein